MSAKCQKQTYGRSLLDHPISGGEQHLWHSETERAGGLEVDDQLKFDRLFHRQVRGLGALQDLIHVPGSAQVQIGKAWSI